MPGESEISGLPIIIRPKYWAIFLHKYWITLLIVLVALILPVLKYYEIAELDRVIILILVGLALFLLIVALLHTKLYQMVTTYEVNRDSVVKRYGIIHKRTLNAPMEMVTDTSIQRGIPDHILKTATLLVNTAGTNEYALHLKYMSLEYSRYLDRIIFELKREARSYSGPPSQPQPKGQPKGK